MSTVLTVPLSRCVNSSAVTQAIADKLPNAVSLRALEGSQVEKALSVGKIDDWLDSLVLRIAESKADNIVVEGIKPDAEKWFLAALNVELALSLNANVVFVVDGNDGDVECSTDKLNIAKQAYTTTPDVLVGFLLEGSADADFGKALAEKTGLVYLGSNQNIGNTDLFLKASVRMPPAQFRVRMMESARKANKRIVLPEGSEPRTVKAAAICHEKGIARCVLLASRAEVEAVAQAHQIALPNELEIIEPSTLVEQYVMPMCQLRKSKGLTPEQAREQLQDTVVLGTMMLSENDVDGLVSGAVHTTANTIRPALQLIKTAPSTNLVSSVFFMLLPNQVLVYGDCAVNPEPTAEQLADIAIQSADSAKMFGIEPKVAMISYSTGTSGAGPSVEKVTQAVALVREKRPDIDVDGPLQYDAATVPSVAKTKAPESTVAGRATVLVFPDLNTGNCTYKAVQRSANILSVGPMLQGLRKPVNDLSRGALVNDIVYTIALTAIQAAQVTK